MAKAPAKQAIEPITPPEIAAPEINLEDAIADELLNDIDWQRVRTALIRKAKAKFVEMLFGNGSDRPVNISAFPELSALPSSDDEVKAA